MELMPVASWDEFKATCITRKNLTCQYRDLGDRYDLFGPEAGTFLWFYTMLKSDPRSGEQADFEDNYEVNFNWAVGNRAYTFSTPDFDFCGDAVYDVCPAGETKEIDYEFTENLYINGGCVILSGSVVGDWLEVKVIHPVYGAIKTYVKKRYVPASPAGASSPVVEINTPYAGKIPAGLKLRMIFHSTGTEDVKIASNYSLHRPI